MAEHFATFLNNIFGQPTPISIDPEPPDKDQQPKHHIQTHKITLDEMITTLSSCKQSGAPGMDMITFKMIKLCPPNIMSFMVNLFKASLKQEHIPSNWKISKVIMIHKTNKPKESFSCYRPISLISCISNILEKIINNRLQH